MNTLRDWKRKTVDGRNATASCSRRSACFISLPSRVPTHAAQYDRVDPTEFQSLKDEIEKLKSEKAAWEAEQATHLTEQQEKVIITTFSFASKIYIEDCLDCRFGENEQGAEGCDHQEQPDLPATDERAGC